MRMLLTTFLLAAALGVAHAGDAPVPQAPFTGKIADKSRICMMQDSLQPKAGLAQEYQGKTYWLCCQMCVEAFTADPNRFARATDPVSGTVVDKATALAYAVNGKAFYFGSEQNRDLFAKNPARYLQGG